MPVEAWTITGWVYDDPYRYDALLDIKQFLATQEHPLNQKSSYAHVRHVKDQDVDVFDRKTITIVIGKLEIFVLELQLTAGSPTWERSWVLLPLTDDVQN